jgi:hypothetical protein
MAKAGGNTTTTWILLFEARALVIKAYDGAVKLAGDLLVKWLGEERVRWSCKLFEAAPVSKLAALNADPMGPAFFVGVADVAYSEGDPAFWRAWLDIRWEENSARERAIGGNKAHGIRVAGEDLLAVLSEELGEYEEAAALPRQHRSGKSLIEAEVKRRAKAGERWDSITKLSWSLNEWMKTVSDKPLEPRSIENILREGDLWSLLSKK